MCPLPVVALPNGAILSHLPFWSLGSEALLTLLDPPLWGVLELGVL